jgi:hypothetical protein
MDLCRLSVEHDLVSSASFANDTSALPSRRLQYSKLSIAQRRKRQPTVEPATSPPRLGQDPPAWRTPLKRRTPRCHLGRPGSSSSQPTLQARPSAPKRLHGAKAIASRLRRAGDGGRARRGSSAGGRPSYHFAGASCVRRVDRGRGAPELGPLAPGKSIRTEKGPGRERAGESVSLSRVEVLNRITPPRHPTFPLVRLPSLELRSPLLLPSSASDETRQDKALLTCLSYLLTRPHDLVVLFIFVSLPPHLPSTTFQPSTPASHGRLLLAGNKRTRPPTH